MDHHDRAREAEAEEAFPAQIIVERAPGGLLIEVAGHRYLGYRSCPLGCKPDPDEVFLAGLVTSAALKLESLLREHGASVHDFRLAARVDRTPAGKRRVTLEPRFPAKLSGEEREEISRELVGLCCRYGIARSDMELEVEVGQPRAALAIAERSAPREEANVS